MRVTPLQTFALIAGFAAVGCSGTDDPVYPSGTGGEQTVGGGASMGGSVGVGGSVMSGGTVGVGGSQMGGASIGGSVGMGASAASGGHVHALHHRNRWLEMLRRLELDAVLQCPDNGARLWADIPHPALRRVGKLEHADGEPAGSQDSHRNGGWHWKRRLRDSQRGDDPVSVPPKELYPSNTSSMVSPLAPSSALAATSFSRPDTAHTEACSAPLSSTLISARRA